MISEAQQMMLKLKKMLSDNKADPAPAAPAAPAADPAAPAAPAAPADKTVNEQPVNILNIINRM